MRITVLPIAAAALASSILIVPAASGQAAPARETFSATASVKSDALTGTAPVRITIERFATEAERASAMKAVKSGGTPALHKVLMKMKNSGTLQLGKKKTPIKYAYASSTGAGRIISILTAAPMIHLGAGLPDAKPKAGYDVAVVLLVLDANNAGEGELDPAAKVKMNESGAIEIDDYGDAKIWLKGVAKAK